MSDFLFPAQTTFILRPFLILIRPMSYCSQIYNWILCLLGVFFGILNQRSKPLYLGLLPNLSIELLLPLHMGYNGCHISYMVFIFLILLQPCDVVTVRACLITL